MKINSLTIENITSLEGKHFINFDKDLAGVTNLFAITGKTGSGKSSILSAISLALFGKNYKTQLNSVDYISLGQKKANVALEFEVGGEEYRAIWECRRTLKRPVPKRALYRGEELIDEPIETIIGINYEQFKKTVILNQGQFANFISSTFTERKKILESLYDGSEVLKDISPRITKELKIIDQEIRNIEKIDEISFSYTEEEMNSFRKKLENNKPTILKNKETIEISNKILEDVKDTCFYLNKHLAYRQKIDELVVGTPKIEQQVWSSQKVHDEQKVKLSLTEENYTKNTPIIQAKVDAFRKLTSAIEKQKEIDLQIKELGQEVSKENKKLQEVSDQVNILNKKLSQINLDAAHTKISEKQLSHLEKDLKEYRQIDSRMTLNKQNLSHTIQNCVETDQKLFELQSKISSIKSKVAGRKKEQSSEDLAMATEQKLQDITHQLGEFKEQIKSRSISLEDAKLAESLLIKLQEEEASLLKNLTPLREKELSLTEQKHNNELAIAVSLCSQESNKNHQCVVCDTLLDGNITNKSVSEYFNHDELDQLRASIDDISKKLVLSEEKIRVKKQELTRLSDKIAKANQLNLEDLVKDSEAKQETLKEKINKRNAITTEISFLEKSMAEKAGETKILLARKQDIEKLKTQNQIQIDKDLEELRELSESINTKYSISPGSEGTENIIQKIKANIEYCRKTDSLMLLKTDIHSRLLDRKTKESRLQERRVSFINSINDLKVTHGVSESENPEIELETLRKALQLDRSKLAESKEKLNSEQFKLKSHENQIKSLQDQLSSYKSQLELTLQKIVHQIGSTDIEIITSNEKFKNIQDIDLSDPNDYQLHKTYFEELKDKSIPLMIEDINRTLESLIQESASLSSKIEEYEKVLSKRKKLQIKLMRLQQDHSKLSKLNSLFGADQFRNFALGLLEKDLIQHTNKELKNLCDNRYRIVQEEQNKGNKDFFIIDYWNESKKRKVSTLSGGEIFLISLAMALALSNMSKGKALIQTFFIDEGFGSLDPENIDDVYGVLNSMGGKNRDIGIISHVKYLTDQIPLNYHLEKVNGNITKITQVYN